MNVPALIVLLIEFALLAGAVWLVVLALEQIPYVQPVAWVVRAIGYLLMALILVSLATGQFPALLH